MNGSTNSQLTAWCKSNLPRELNFLGVYEANTLPKKVPPTSCLIVSYGGMRHGSTNVLHWCAASFKAGYGAWLDPMGQAPGADFSFPTPFEHFMRSNSPGGFTYQKKRLEQWTGKVPTVASTDCGQWCCYMLKNGSPADNPDAYRWLTSSLAVNATRLLQKVRLTGPDAGAVGGDVPEGLKLPDKEAFDKTLDWEWPEDLADDMRTVRDMLSGVGGRAPMTPDEVLREFEQGGAAREVLRDYERMITIIQREQRRQANPVIRRALDERERVSRTDTLTMAWKNFALKSRVRRLMFDIGQDDDEIVDTLADDFPASRAIVRRLIATVRSEGADDDDDD